jgi:hypothetical protein
MKELKEYLKKRCIEARGKLPESGVGNGDEGFDVGYNLATAHACEDVLRWLELTKKLVDNQ